MRSSVKSQKERLLSSRTSRLKRGLSDVPLLVFEIWVTEVFGPVLLEPLTPTLSFSHPPNGPHRLRR